MIYLFFFFFQNLFYSQSGRLLIIINLIIKFQGSSFNCFWDKFAHHIFSKERGIILSRNKYVSIIFYAEST